MAFLSWDSLFRISLTIPALSGCLTPSSVALSDTMQNLQPTEIQCDEVWGFVRSKERTAFFNNGTEGCGDAYAFTAIDRHRKLDLTDRILESGSESASSRSGLGSSGIDGRRYPPSPVTAASSSQQKTHGR
jgi:hypothetical protein